jgi:hypothetical protein
MESPIDALLKFIEKVKHTEDHELDCEEVFAVIDVYAEAVASGRDAPDLLPLVKHHLEICQDCFEEYQALMRVLEQSGENSPSN